MAPSRWAIALAGLALWACAEQRPREAAPPPVELLLWHTYTGGEARALAEVIDAFQATPDAPRVRLVAIPFDAFADKITVAVPRGNGPDLFIFAHDRIGGWAESRVLEPIGFWADEALIERFFIETVRPLVYREALYGLPLAFKTLALFYDRRLVEGPPATTGELIERARAARDRDPQVWGIVTQEPDSLYFHAPWLHGFGGQIYERGDTLALASPAVAASARWVRGLIDDHLMPEEPTAALVSALFNRHQVAYVINGPWFRGEISHDEWGVGMLPVVSATGRRARPFLGVEAVLLSRRSRHKRAAFRLMRWLTSDAVALQRLRDGGQLVANRAPYDDPALAGDTFIRAFQAQVEHTVPLSNRPHMRRVWTPAKSALSAILFHDQPAAEALADAVRQIERQGGAR